MELACGRYVFYPTILLYRVFLIWQCRIDPREQIGSALRNLIIRVTARYFIAQDEIETAVVSTIIGSEWTARSVLDMNTDCSYCECDF